MAIKIETFIDLEKAAKDTATGRVGENLDWNDVFQVSSLLFYYGTQLAKAEAQLSNMKLTRDLAYATAKQSAAQELRDAGEKTTVDAVESKAKVDVRYIKTVKLVAQAEEVFDTIRAAVSALSAKKDMLTLLGNRDRDERKIRQVIADEVAPNTKDFSERQQALREKMGS